MSTTDHPGLVGKPDYGIDAPGVRRGMFIAAACGAFIAAVASSAQGFALVGAGAASTTATALTALGLMVAAYGWFMGAYMTYGSRIGKLRTRDRLLDQVAGVRGWQGNEAVLDVGCGRGLMLIGAAKRMATGGSGQAIGVDSWRSEDQTANSAAAALANAKIEGVADRVRVDTGDARALPYADASFDVVMSHWVVHNLEPAADRLQALDEMLRVLRPGGVLVLADIAGFPLYRQHLVARGMTLSHFDDGGLEATVMGALSGGSYRPQSLLTVQPPTLG